MADMVVDKWCFSKERLENTPSRKHDIDINRELSYRQQAANFIQDMGQRLQLYPFYIIIFIPQLLCCIILRVMQNFVLKVLSLLSFKVLDQNIPISV